MSMQNLFSTINGASLSASPSSPSGLAAHGNYLGIFNLIYSLSLIERILKDMLKEIRTNSKLKIFRKFRAFTGCFMSLLEKTYNIIPGIITTLCGNRD